jgi:glycosyltransferase involved in cell wall biosynthesis
MRVLHLAASDAAGGASRAAYRIHKCLEADDSIDSQMLVSRRFTADMSVHTLEVRAATRAVGASFRRGFNLERYRARAVEPRGCSTARVPTTAPSKIRAISPDVVLLHWLGNEVMSVAQIGRLIAGHIPTVFVLHDTWAFCGAEHYPEGEGDTRFIEGYLRHNRPRSERGPDLNRSTWERKRRHWRSPARVIAPSRWMAEKAQQSALMRGWKTEVIPNPLDVKWWGAISRAAARERLGLSQSLRIVLFGAIGGVTNRRKGADILFEALPKLKRQMEMAGEPEPTLVTFGGSAGVVRINGLEVRSVGTLNDEMLRLYYSAANVMVVPSRQDNLPQTAVESIACGTPVVAFAVGGLTDIVSENVTGLLVEPFSSDELANQIFQVLADREVSARISAAAKRISHKWDYSNVRLSYRAVLEDLCK